MTRLLSALGGGLLILTGCAGLVLLPISAAHPFPLRRSPLFRTDGFIGCAQGEKIGQTCPGR